MSRYRFTAFDASGKEHEGTLDAANAQEAARQLVSRGLRVRMIQESKDAAPTGQAPTAQRPQPRPPQPAQRPPSSRQAPIQQPSPRNAPQQVVNMPAPPQPKVFRTAAGSDKDRFFLFSQIASGLRAGINPAEFFMQIAPRTKGVYRDSLQRLGNSASEGIAMSAVMSQYPDLYPPSVVAGVRAGEVGGFLPDACEMIAQQAENAHRFKRFFWWVSTVVISALVCVPGILIFRVGFLASWDATEARGGSSNSSTVLADMGHAAWKAFMWPYGPVTAVVALALFLMWRFSLASASRPIRHKLGLGWPVFGNRAKHENLTIFSWTMSKLTSAGLPHQQAWDMAAAAVPNMAMQTRLEQVGERISRSEKISDVVHSSELFPQEYAPVMATAEYTGNLPGALEQLSQTSRAEFDAQQNYAKYRGGCWGCLATVITGAFIIGVAMYMYYRELPAKILKDMDTP